MKFPKKDVEERPAREEEIELPTTGLIAPKSRRLGAAPGSFVDVQLLRAPGVDFNSLPRQKGALPFSQSETRIPQAVRDIRQAGFRLYIKGVNLGDSSTALTTIRAHASSDNDNLFYLIHALARVARLRKIFAQTYQRNLNKAEIDIDALEDQVGGEAFREFSTAVQNALVLRALSVPA